MTTEEKLDEALKGTFPASDAVLCAPGPADVSGGYGSRRARGGPA